MKKILAFLLAVGICFAFTACGEEEKSSRKSKDSSAAQQIGNSIADYLQEHFVNQSEETAEDNEETTEKDYAVQPNHLNVTKEPFLVYLSGSDSTDINKNGNSDVNMIIAVNPTEHKILLINTPKDYYVPLYGGDVVAQGGKGELDKLAHAGIYGIDCSIQTLENLYDIEFNYYVKFTPTLVVELVDEIGGITVDSEYAFSSKYGLENKTYHFVKGKNELDGDAALAFARERNSLSGGERQRGKNQQLVMSAIINKVSSSITIDEESFNNLLSISTSHMETNISVNKIKALFQMQLDDMTIWYVESISADGTYDSNYTYTYPSQSLLVIAPDYEIVEEVKNAIKAFMK